eukprot:PhF_6_TR14291/c1_g1_i1/m.22966
MLSDVMYHLFPIGCEDICKMQSERSKTTGDTPETEGVTGSKDPEAEALTMLSNDAEAVTTPSKDTKAVTTASKHSKPNSNTTAPSNLTVNLPLICAPEGWDVRLSSVHDTFLHCKFFPFKSDESVFAQMKEKIEERQKNEKNRVCTGSFIFAPATRNMLCDIVVVNLRCFDGSNDHDVDTVDFIVIELKDRRRMNTEDIQKKIEQATAKHDNGNFVWKRVRDNIVQVFPTISRGCVHHVIGGRCGEPSFDVLGK